MLEPGSEALAYRVLADRLMSEEGIGVIFGCCTSASRKAVLPVVERRGGLLWYPSLYEGFEYSPNIIYNGAVPNQTIVDLAGFLFAHYGRRFYLVGSNYIYPRETNRIIKEFLAESGGTVAAERYLPLNAGAAPFAEIAADIRRVRPDVVFSTVVGRDTAHLYAAYAAAGGEPARVPIASITTSESEIALVPRAARAGHITAAAYFSTVETAANTAFQARYAARFGADEPPSMYAEATYFQIHLFAEAVAAHGHADPEVLKTAVLGASIDAPQGPVTVDPDNNHTYLWSRIGRSTAAGAFELLWQAAEPAKPDPYLVAYHRGIPATMSG